MARTILREQGRFDVKITDAYVEDNKGKIQLNIEFEVLSGPHAGSVVYFCSSADTEKAAARCGKILEACGQKEGDQDLENVVGAKVNVVVEAREYCGRQYYNVAYVNTIPTEKKRTPLAKAEAAKFVARARRAHKAVTEFAKATAELEPAPFD